MRTLRLYHSPVILVAECEGSGLPEYPKNEIESREMLSRDMFYTIEEHLDEFLDYVPYDSNHLKVYSHKLVSIMLEVGPEILSSFDIAVSEAKNRLSLADDSVVKDAESLWRREERLKRTKKSLSFFDYYRFLDKHSMPRLSNATIGLVGSDAYLMPFEESSLQWWESYNLLRHDKYANLKTANLSTALKACSALFWLVYQNQTFSGFESAVFLPKDWGEWPHSFRIV